MAHRLIEQFHWLDGNARLTSTLSDQERYQQLIDWAHRARSRNPLAFDNLTDWLMDDAEWTGEQLAENRLLLMHGVLARFREQNAQLRARLMELRPSGLVNEAAFKALDRFDAELAGASSERRLREAVTRMFNDFTLMLDRDLRRTIAGDKSGPEGVDTIDFYGYINCLKDCDAQVQWSLFMPDAVKRQQDGFRLESFDYVKAPAMRFIGREGDELDELVNRRTVFATLDSLIEYSSAITADILFMHHHGQCVDTSPWHGLWGRFMRPGTPVPKGFECIDLVPVNDGEAGTPYLSQYAYATFSGDIEAMHRRKGYDSDAMYDVTRNVILGQGVLIPYPHKYWTAEVFTEGYRKPSTAYMFSVDLGT